MAPHSGPLTASVRGLSCEPLGQLACELADPAHRSPRVRNVPRRPLGMHLNVTLLALLLLAVVVVLGLLRRRVQTQPGGRWAYFAKKVMTEPEQVRHIHLVKALPEQIVLAQVQLSRILGVQRGRN